MWARPPAEGGKWKGLGFGEGRGGSKNGVGRIKRLVGVEEQQLLQLLIDLSFFKTVSFLWDVDVIY